MKVPRLDPEVTGSYKRTLNTAVLIWMMNAPARRRAKSGTGRHLLLMGGGSIGMTALAHFLWNLFS